MHITLYIIVLWLTKTQKQQECFNMFYCLERHRDRAGVTSLLSNPIHFSARYFFTKVKDQLNVLKLNIIMVRSSVVVYTVYTSSDSEITF